MAEAAAPAPKQEEKPVKSNLEKSIDKANKAQEDAKKALEERRDKILEKFDESMADLIWIMDGSFFWLYFMDWWWMYRIDTTILKDCIPGPLDPDIRMLITLTRKLAMATFKGLIGVLKIAGKGIISSANPIQILMGGAMFTVLSAQVADVCETSIARLVSLVEEIIRIFYIEKLKIYVLTMKLYDDKAYPTLMLDISKKQLKRTLSNIKTILKKYLDDMIEEELKMEKLSMPPKEEEKSEEEKKEDEKKEGGAAGAAGGGAGGAGGKDANKGNESGSGKTESKESGKEGGGSKEGEKDSNSSNESENAEESSEESGGFFSNLLGGIMGNDEEEDNKKEESNSEGGDKKEGSDKKEGEDKKEGGDKKEGDKKEGDKKEGDKKEEPKKKTEAEIEQEMRDKISKSMEELSKRVLRANTKMDTIEKKLPDIEDEIINLFFGMCYKLELHTFLITPLYIELYKYVMKGINESHDIYAKMIASSPTEMKAKGNAKTDEKTQGKDPEKDKKETDPGVKKAEVKKTDKPIDSKKKIEEVKPKQEAEQKKDESEYSEITINSLKSLPEMIETQAKKLSDDLVYQFESALYTKAYVDGFNALMNFIKMFYMVTEKILRRYYNLRILLKSYRHNVEETYESILKISMGTEVIEKLFKELYGDDINLKDGKSDESKLYMEMMNKKASSLIDIEDLINKLELAKMCAEIIANLPIEVATVVAKVAADTAKQLIEIPKKMVEVLFDALKENFKLLG